MIETTMIDTTIYIGNVAIHEPMTVFTDVLIAIVAFTCYMKLSHAREAVKYWSWFFLFLSMSTLVGSFSHAFFAVHEGWGYKSFWLPMQILNGLGVYFAQQATLRSALKDSKHYNAWKMSYNIQLVVYYIVLLLVQKYIVTIIDNALGLIPIMIVHLTARIKKEYYKYVGWGIAISFITAIVHGTKFSLHAYFNYNDIAHVFIMISLIVIYVGIKKKADA